MSEVGDLVKAVNQGLKAEKAGVSIRQRRNKLCLRAVLPHKDGSNREVQYDVPTGCDATKAGLNRAKTLAIKLSTDRKLGTFSWDCWLQSGETTQAPEEPSESQTIGAWTARFKADWYEKRDVSTTAQKSQAKRTWDRIEASFKKIPDTSDLLTIEALVAVAKSLPAASKARHEFCQKAKALAKFAELPTKELDKVHTKYRTRVPKLPLDEELFEFALNNRHSGIYGWCFAALLVYGCRVSEVFSLVPSETGATASVLGIKQKNAPPEQREALALPKEWIEPLEICTVERPYEFLDPVAYDSNKTKGHVDRMNKWLQSRWCGTVKLENSNLRHSWCIRSILKSQLGDGVAAKAAGHDISIHMRTYAAAMQKRDILRAAENL
ncbi:putative phage integrase [Synechococcus sp. A18-46.1]|nr:putative phage integrase [Synechococcus sp. A18-46.1]